MEINFQYEEYNSGESQPFRYTGAYHDDEVNLYYLRARHYLPILRVVDIQVGVDLSFIIGEDMEMIEFLLK